MDVEVKMRVDNQRLEAKDFRAGSYKITFVDELELQIPNYTGVNILLNNRSFGKDENYTGGVKHLVLLGKGKVQAPTVRI
jgi:hypothetical protein